MALLRVTDVTDPAQLPAPTRDELAAAPKVVLHDHLDGGMRAETLLDLAADIGHELPRSSPGPLGQWVQEQADSGSLAAFLEPFAHTTAVLQTGAALTRVAHEAVLDLAADGVVYAESRFAPELSTAGGLSLDEVVEAVVAGLRSGEVAAAELGRPITARAVVCAMRQGDRSLEAARTALAHRDDGVVGFDIAGPEIGFPATDHAAAFALLREALFPFTAHAGEAVGPESVAQALAVGASRIGHGVRVLEDVEGSGGGARFGRVAGYVRDRQVPLEVCPRSNVQTGTSPSIAGHQVTALRDLGFTITLSSDDRLWTGTTLTDEMLLLVEHAGWTWDDLRQVTIDALDAAFIDQGTRTALLEHVVVPGWER